VTRSATATRPRPVDGGCAIVPLAADDRLASLLLAIPVIVLWRRRRR
jgi:hypothetical protein